MKISANLKKISTFLLAVFLVVFAFKSPVLALITDLNIDDSSPAAISDDGRYIVFFSDRTDLIIGDTNGEKDVFLYDRDTDTTERVNVDSLENESVGDAPIINWSTQTGADITPDGRYVVFGSLAPDLVAGDTNGVSDVFVRDRTLGTTEIVSVDDLGNEGDDASARGLNFTGSFLYLMMVDMLLFTLELLI